MKINFLSLYFAISVQIYVCFVSAYWSLVWFCQFLCFESIFWRKSSSPVANKILFKLAFFIHTVMLAEVANECYGVPYELCNTNMAIRFISKSIPVTRTWAPNKYYETYWKCSTSVLMKLISTLCSWERDIGSNQSDTHVSHCYDKVCGRLV